MRRVWLVLAIALARPVEAAVDVQVAASGIPYLVGSEHAGDGSGRLFLVSQSGQIYIYNGTQVLATPFLDVSAVIAFGGEQGLLGLAFHPGYASNGVFFVHYTD